MMAAHAAGGSMASGSENGIIMKMKRNSNGGKIGERGEIMAWAWREKSINEMAGSGGS
jgi:hypothetical protein